MSSFLCILGTRPEAIKLSPFIHLCRQDPHIQITTCLVGQHPELAKSALAQFKLTPEIQLPIAYTSLSDLTTQGLAALSDLLSTSNFDLIVVQGDTTTALIAALSGFYHKIPVAHIEAGLRTSNPMTPYPEEMNRRLIDQISSFHFAPTQTALDHLKAEGHTAPRWHVGNTGIDALMWIRAHQTPTEPESIPFVLVTCHRRENWETDLDNLLESLLECTHQLPEIRWIFPVHPNPFTQEKIRSKLDALPNLITPPPLDYSQFVRVMETALFIVTDSGGIQEEATALGKPTLVLRTQTERPEALKAGITHLISTDPETLVPTLIKWAKNPPQVTPSMCFGDGTASQKILNHLKEAFYVSA
jgi:UDP-N-acetylglucosamine 2-epimerase (non-hydrolysing)